MLMADAQRCGGALRTVQRRTAHGLPPGAASCRNKLCTARSAPFVCFLAVQWTNQHKLLRSGSRPCLMQPGTRSRPSCACGDVHFEGSAAIAAKTIAMAQWRVYVRRESRRCVQLVPVLSLSHAHPKRWQSGVVGMGSSHNFSCPVNSLSLSETKEQNARCLADCRLRRRMIT